MSGKRITLTREVDLFPDLSSTSDKRARATSTFIHNMGLPVHRWYRFPAGFSAEWARTLIAHIKQVKGNVVLLDPFGGVGTAVLAGEEAGVRSYGLEAQPFIARIAQAKLLWHTNVDEFLSFATAVLEEARAGKADTPRYPDLVLRCYPDQTLNELHSLKVAWLEVKDTKPASELTWLAIAAILRACSPVGTAPWQYVLPKKRKSKVLSPYEAFASQVTRMAADMAQRQTRGIWQLGKIFVSDARKCPKIAEKSVQLVLTSPPYPNNYDYADATRLEMTFFGEVERWADLHQKARRGLIRSCSQHVSIEGTELGDVLNMMLSDSPIDQELRSVCAKLAAEREQHGGRKHYHVMVAAYFADMNEVLKSLRRVCVEGSLLCFVVGDSAPYGVHVPVDRWLGELALHAGFRSYRFEQVRERNVKWKNRKHRVPLHEGHLWLEG